MDDSQLTSSNPLRPANWRFLRADRLAKEGRVPSPTKYDHVTCTLALYLQTGRLDGTRNLSSLADGVDIHAAHQIYAHAHDLRAAIEAAILADIEREWIATRIGVSVGCVLWFEAGFFDVRSRLGASFFILNHVIATAREHSSADWQQYGLKLIGYLAGADVLEQAMGVNPITNLEDLEARLDLKSRIVLQEKVCHAMQTLEIDSPAIAARMLQARNAGAKTSSSKDKPFTAIEQNIKAMMEGLGPRFTVGPDSNACAAVKEWHTTAVELNCEETDFVAMGGKLPWGDVLKRLRFPDPPQPAQH